MTKTTNYCIIDHMGSLTQSEITEVYANATQLAKDAGYEMTFTIKSFVKRYMPRVRNIEGAKWVVRNNRHPQLVLFICPNELTAKIKSGIKAWNRKGITVKLVQPKKERLYTPSEAESKMFYDYGDTDSKRRMIASIWAPALGYTFEHPLYRTKQDEIPDMYMHQSSQYVDVDPDDLSTYSTKGETFLNAKRAIVSETELNEFWQFYKAVRSSEMPIEEFLDPDYAICPNCGRPYKTGISNSASCPRCDYTTNDVEFTSYWDDRGEEPEDESLTPNYDPFDIGFDTDDSNKFFCGIPIEHRTSEDRSGSTTFVSTNYDETWRWYNTYEDGLTK